MTSTERTGTRDEVQKESQVILSGSWQGEEFQAEAVVLFIVDM